MPIDADETDPWKRPHRAPPERPPAAPPPPRRRTGTAGPLVLGLVAAAGVGVGVALTLLNQRPAQEPRLAQAEMAPVSQAMPVELAAPPPSPAPPRADARLEVLPPGPSLPPPAMTPPPAPSSTGRMARAPVLAAVGTPAPATAMSPDRSAPQPAAGPRPDIAAPAAERTAPARCGWARSPAERLVCEDRGLSAADRRMQRAYDDALDAGASADELAADQAYWRQVREEAARRSRDVVASVYEQRIEELEALAAPR